MLFRAAGVCVLNAACDWVSGVPTVGRLGTGFPVRGSLFVFTCVADV